MIQTKFSPKRRHPRFPARFDAASVECGLGVAFAARFDEDPGFWLLMVSWRRAEEAAAAVRKQLINGSVAVAHAN
jgi:hypothetical protein